MRIVALIAASAAALTLAACNKAEETAIRATMRMGRSFVRADDSVPNLRYRPPRCGRK